MELTFPIINTELLVVEIHSKKVLLSTGINISLANENKIELLDENFQVDSEYLGYKIADVKKQLNLDIDILLGSNILSKFNYKVNTKTKTFTLTDESFSNLDNAIPLKNQMQLPILNLTVKGKSLDLILDTSSKFAYLNEKFMIDEQLIAEKEDYYPTMGTFSTKTYNMNYNWSDKSLQIETGILPSIICKTRHISADKGIIGYDLLRKGTITIDNRNQQAYIEKY